MEAVDDDAEVLKEAERLAAELHVTGVAFRHADLHELPAFPPGASPSSSPTVCCTGRPTRQRWCVR